MSNPFLLLFDSKAVLTGLTLGNITNAKNLDMNYVNYDKAIMLLHGVKIIGWPLEAFVSPSDVTNVIEIRKLRDAWKSGSCKWVRLTEAELNAHAASLEEREKNGKTIRKPRKKRSDAGVPRGKRKRDDKENAGPSAKRSKAQRGAKKRAGKKAAGGKSKQPTSAEYIYSSDEEDRDEGDDEDDDEDESGEDSE